jgi:hypothetical protein
MPTTAWARVGAPGVRGAPSKLCLKRFVCRFCGRAFGEVTVRSTVLLQVLEHCMLD